jgi:DNA replicative helicase MCM subunit Mcm2 (Cdc46/Mcm family)
MSLIDIARTLNQTIILGEDVWRMALLSVISPYAPRVTLNGLKVRANLNLLMAGDVSTAKSAVIEVLKKIAPRWNSITKATDASLEGSSNSISDFTTGLLESASDGILVIPEFQSHYFNSIQTLREALDGNEIRIFKRGQMRNFTPNITLIAACNPKEDFYTTKRELRSQIGYKEGLITRFDILIPMLASAKLNEAVVDKMNLFGEATAAVDLEEIANQLAEVRAAMRKVDSTSITPDQQTRIKDSFKLHNQRKLRNRPFLILRDLEVVCRLVNSIVTFNIRSHSIHEGKVLASDDEVNLAINLWEYLLALREEFYTETTRSIQTLDDRILEAIKSKGTEHTEAVKAIICDQMRLCSEATFYRRLSNLVSLGQVKHQKGPGATVTAAEAEIVVELAG